MDLARLHSKCSEILQAGGDPESVLSYLRQEGCTKEDSIPIVQGLLKLPPAQAKALVQQSRTWGDVRGRDDALHARAAKARIAQDAGRKPLKVVLEERGYGLRRTILGLIGLLAAGSIAWYLWAGYMAKGQGAERLHQEAEAKLWGASPHARYLSEFRYPDTFIYRVKAGLGRAFTPKELEVLLGPGAERRERATAEGREITWTYRAHGILLYEVEAGWDAKGEQVKFATREHGVRWHPKMEAGE